jgi:acyl-coenzyme A synthetase/AMP-(fatty) acid ligase/3-hydroxymyristoyl/3-hydroxydecanoyl-(acyl carrier protein) dehydratase
VRRILAHAPGDPVAVGPGGALTASDLVADAGRVAAELSDGEPGALALLCSDRYHFAAALLGAWQAGRIVLLPQNAQPDTLRALCQDPGVRLLLHDRDGGAEGTHIGAVLSRTISSAAWPEVDETRHLVTLMTSGSTGVHQRCAKTGVQLLGEATTLADVFGVGRGARILASVPPNHIYGLLFGVLLPLRGGGIIIRGTPLHVESVAACLRRYGASHLVSVPAHLATLADADDLPSLECVFSSGAPLPAITSETLRKRSGWRVVEVYGSTETGGIAWRTGSDPWHPLPGVSVSTADDGRILVSSPFLPRETGPYLGADLISPAAGGGFSLLGRRDGIAKVGGIRVSLREIEERLLEIPGVRDSAALIHPSGGTRGEEIWVAVAADGVTQAQLRKALSDWFDPAALPRRIRILDVLPREETGKLAHERLLELFQDDERIPVTTIEPIGERLDMCDAIEARVLSFLVPPDLVYFQGHFGGMPVLPAVVQMDGLVLRQIDRLWPDLGAPRQVLRLKFKGLIRPGDRLQLRLVLDATRPAVTFDIQSPRGPCSSGTLVFGSSGSTP